MTEWRVIPDPFWPFPGRYAVVRYVQDEQQILWQVFYNKAEAQTYADALNNPVTD